VTRRLGHRSGGAESQAGEPFCRHPVPQQNRSRRRPGAGRVCPSHAVPGLASAASAGARCVRQDLKRSLRDLERRIEKMRRAALAVMEQDPELRLRFTLLLSMPGIGEVSALNLLGELALLAPSLTVRQWVAHSGLDPAHHDSGTSVHKRSRISRAGNRYLRRALYMPALVAVRHDPHLRAFYQALVARHKTKLQALIAAARKILHAIFGMF